MDRSSEGQSVTSRRRVMFSTRTQRLRPTHESYLLSSALISTEQSCQMSFHPHPPKLSGKWFAISFYIDLSYVFTKRTWKISFYLLLRSSYFSRLSTNLKIKKKLVKVRKMSGGAVLKFSRNALHIQEQPE